MANEIVKHDSATDLSLYERMPDPLMAIEKLGGWITKSGMFGVTKPEQGQIIALACMVDKISPVEFKRKYHVIESERGTELAMKADYMLADFQKRGGQWTWKRFDDLAAVARVKYGLNDLEISYTMEDAQKAGLIKARGAYEKNPSAQLRARLASKAIRMMMPEVVAGVYTPEEVNEFGPPKTVTSVQVLHEPEPDYQPPVEEEPPMPLDQVIATMCNCEKAIAYLVSIGWLKSGQGLKDVAPGHANIIRERLSDFAEKVAVMP